LNKKLFGQKIGALSYSEGCDVAKTSVCSIFKQFEASFLK
jgi:hypothetical protein